MAISSVKAKINNTWYTLAYDSASGAWKGTITAPGATSFNLDGGYYPVTIEATNDAGTKTTADPSDGTVGSALKLVVKETIAPVITISSPTGGAYVTNSQQPIVFQVVDESGGSGVDADSISVKLNGAAVTSITKTAITNGYTCTVTPPTMSDGENTVVINASDNDGNAAAEKSVTFIVDTVPPTLNITSPSDGIITANSSVTVQGTTNDATSSPVTVEIILNGISQGTATVSSSGNFSKVITLAEGSNTIKVTAKDTAGRSTTVTRTVTLDTSVPKIASVSIAPNPANTEASMIISVVVE